MTGLVELFSHITFFISCEMSTSVARNKTDIDFSDPR